jgi:hypothetical protein
VRGGNRGHRGIYSTLLIESQSFCFGSFKLKIEFGIDPGFQGQTRIYNPNLAILSMATKTRVEEGSVEEGFV